jgi:DNA adenine methylase
VKYLGSKRRIAKDILPIILADRQPGQVYVEPFCGGCNLIDKVTGPRIAADINPYLIAFLSEDFAPFHVGESLYKHIQQNKDGYPAALVGYAGFCLSFGAKFFGGYRRDKAGVRDYENEAQQNIRAQQNIKAQQPYLQGVEFHCCNYYELAYPEQSLIYCDPPYAGTTGYLGGFDHEVFWGWVRGMTSLGHTVFVSEFSAPDDFECLWEKEIPNVMNGTAGKRGTEKLFKLKEVGEWR